MGLQKKIEDMFAAVAFAEAGEHDTAREILRESGDAMSSAPPRVAPEAAVPEAD